ncbi:MAG: DUF885 domain-containing protein, partial [Pseudonocardiaceae bacterium]
MVVSPDPDADQINAYLDWYFDQHPVKADALGAPGYARRLGDFSASAFERLERDATGWLARFTDEPAGIDRDLVISALRGDLLMAGWPAWRRDPSVYLSPVFTGVLLPFLHRLHPEWELVDGVVARLAEVPGVLAACRGNLDPGLSAPRLVRRGLRQAAA